MSIYTYIHACICVHRMMGAKTCVQTCLMYETCCWCVTPNSVYMQMAIFCYLVEDLSLLVSGYVCLTLWSFYVFFCLCCCSLLYDLQVPALPTPACIDFCCLRPRAYENLTTAPSICNPSLSTIFGSPFKMVFVHTVFHYELWSGLLAVPSTPTSSAWLTPVLSSFM